MNARINSAHAASVWLSHFELHFQSRARDRLLRFLIKDPSADETPLERDFPNGRIAGQLRIAVDRERAGLLRVDPPSDPLCLPHRSAETTFRVDRHVGCPSVIAIMNVDGPLVKRLTSKLHASLKPEWSKVNLFRYVLFPDRNLGRQMLQCTFAVQREVILPLG